MKGLDTNVLVRYLTQDDAAQARKATREIEGEDASESLFIADVVMCELVWVLETAYGYGRAEILPVLERVLRTRQFAFEDKDLLWRAVDDYRSVKGDFADHLIGRVGKQTGCRETVTFDAGLKGSPLFRVL